MTSAIDIKVFKTVNDIGREAIDSLVDDGFFTFGWFKTFETSKPINLSPLYLTAYFRGKLAAFAPCFRDIADSYFWFAPDVVPFMRKILNVCNRLHLGQNHVLLCYSPFCYRTKIFHEKGLNEVLLNKSIFEKIDAICKREKILFSSFLFVSEFDKRLLMELENLGYYKFPWRPTLYLDIRWRRFGDYLKSLEHDVRNKVRREMRSCRENGVTIEEVTEFRDLSTILSDLSLNIRKKYDKNASRLFEPCFYESLSDHAKENTIVFIAKKKGVIVGFSLCLRKGDTLDVFQCGFNYELQNKSDFTYFDLCYYTPIRWAIQNGIRKMYYRYTAERIKYKRGCKPEMQYSFVKCHSALINFQIWLYGHARAKNRGLGAR
jgi:predicted N-acyltransferase